MTKKTSFSSKYSLSAPSYSLPKQGRCTETNVSDFDMKQRSALLPMFCLSFRINQQKTCNGSKMQWPALERVNTNKINTFKLWHSCGPVQKLQHLSDVFIVTSANLESVFNVLWCAFRYPQFGFLLELRICLKVHPVCLSQVCLYPMKCALHAPKNKHYAAWSIYFTKKKLRKRSLSSQLASQREK